MALGVTGCSFMRLNNSPPKAQVNSQQLSPKGPSGLVATSVLQQQVMRLADTYVATLAQACDDISTSSTNSDIRLTVLRWKLGQATAAYTDAIGENPAVNAMDLLVLVTMARMVVQDYGVSKYGDAIQPLLQAQMQMESNTWMIARGVLKPSQEVELRGLIQQWREKHPNQRYIGPIRFREFVSALNKMPPKNANSSTSIFSLLYLDPLAGLDPAAAAIQETRELGERAMYYSQRMPMLLSWQVEVLTYQLVGQPESQQLLSDFSRLAASADVFSKTAQQLPGLINDQRQAAIQQIMEGLAANEQKSRQLLSDTRLTLDSASEAATNLNTAIQTLSAFVRYVSPTNAAATSTNSKPFNVLDYGTAAAQVGAAANNLNSLLLSVNRSAPELEKLSRQARANAHEVVRQAYGYGLVLILILLAGSVLAGLLYRILAEKLVNQKRRTDVP